MKTKMILLSSLLFVMGACAGSEESETENTDTDSTSAEVDTTTAKNLEEDETMLEGYEVGDYATDFELKDLDGAMVSLSDYETAKGFIVTFTCNHCPYAVAYEDRIVALDEKYKTQGYPLIAINPNNPEIVEEDSYENMKIRAQEKGFTFPYLFDEKQEVYPQYGATKTPHVYVLEKTDEGNRVAYIGAIDDNHEDAEAVTKKYVEDAVDALLRGEEPEITETKAIGCSIKA